ncbi:methyltransferase domain-containing protein [bacterium]|nr:methyltransferase domain-containing protein [bacterium]
MTESITIHGSRPREKRRASLMNDLLNEAALRELRLAPGERVLDVGTGTALFAREMAWVVGREGAVVGVERDADLIRTARESDGDDDARVDLREGNAHDLPLRAAEWDSFDVVHARFLLEHVPDPVPVVRSMLRAARPGGRVVLADDDHSVFRIHPEPPGFEELWRATIAAFERLGNDPLIGRRLVTLLVDAGATRCRSSCLSFGSCAGQPLFDSAVSNLTGVLEDARDLVLEGGVLSVAEFDRAMRELATWSTLPDASLSYAIDWAEGIRADTR